VPGDGDVPLPRILDDLFRAGYGGPLELELVGPRIESEGYASAIRRGVAYLDHVLDGLGIDG
jgi:sugar phosphate isomerase/epimerase